MRWECGHLSKIICHILRQSVGGKTPAAGATKKKGVRVEGRVADMLEKCV